MNHFPPSRGSPKTHIYKILMKIRFIFLEICLATSWKYFHTFLSHHAITPPQSSPPLFHSPSPPCHTSLSHHSIPVLGLSSLPSSTHPYEFKKKYEGKWWYALPLSPFQPPSQPRFIGLKKRVFTKKIRWFLSPANTLPFFPFQSKPSSLPSLLLFLHNHFRAVFFFSL